MTTAQQFAAVFDDDGQRFTTDTGREFESVAREFGATVQYGRRVPGDLGDEDSYEVGTSTEHFAGDPVRYEFPDGSAIVVMGDGWDHEGDEPFSWAG